MLESSVDDIKKDFINELKDYIPTLRAKVGGLADPSSDRRRKDLKELYRLVHTIKGASSLVKLDDLSKVAFELEDIIEAVMNQNLAVNANVFNAIKHALVYFEAYTAELYNGGPQGQDKRDEALRTLKAVRNDCTGRRETVMMAQLMSFAEEDGGPAGHDDPAFDNIDLEEGDLAVDDAGWTAIDGPEGLDRQIMDSGEDDDDIGEIELPREELLEGFFQEAEEHFEDLGKALGKLEDNIAAPTGLTPEHKELLRLIRRAVHTIKGAAAVIKLTEISGWGHEFEDLLDWLYEEADDISPEDIKVLAESADILEQYVAAPQEINPAKVDDLRAAFRRIIGSGHEVPPTAADGPEGLDRQIMGSGEDDDDIGEIELPREELLEGFFQEAEEHFQDLGKALGKLEDNIAAPTGLTPEHKELLRLIRRAVHTIKGAAAVIKLTEISGWGHEFEDLLDWLYEEADDISPEDIKVLAESADILEQYVTAPQEIDPAKVDDLRAAFRRIIGSGHGDSPAAHSAAVADRLDFEPPDPDPDPANPAQSDPPAGKTSSAPLNQSKTLRVDMAKVESLVNLTSELIITLSAFDQNIGSLGNIKDEIDRSRQRLKGTARDLELGYEVKAIQHLGSHQTMLQSPGVSTGEGGGAFSEFDLLELDRYSEFNLIIRSLNETAVDVSTISTQLNDFHSGFEAYLNRLRFLLSELQEKVMRVRMTPMATLVSRLRRTVRETAAKLGKDVHFSIHGEDIELDKLVWEKLADPLMHLLRNAIDHGIEPLIERRALGKPDTATVQLSAAYQGNQVVIRIMDDGAGLDFEAIRRAAASFTPASKLDDMTQEDLAEMIFLPGFSTRQAVSEVSGRGVGMDVVKENIAGLKGRVQVEASAKDKGTTFKIRIPLTLAVMRALLFTVAGRLYATALYDIKEIQRVNPEDISDRNGGSIKIGERTLPFFRLSDYLAGGPARDPSGDSQTRPLVMVIDTGAWQGAVAIDRMYSQKDVVIKSLGTHLRQVKGITGATVLGDGRIAPIINLEELLTTAAAQLHKPSRPVQPVMQKPLEIMVVDDSVSVRTVVSRLMQRQGWKVQTAKDGVEAMERLHTYRPDLIVLDIEMPRMNGYEFMSAFRTQAEFKDTPVVMLTSRAANKHRDKARALGVNGFMTKPYEDGDFVSLVKRLTQ